MPDIYPTQPLSSDATARVCIVGSLNVDHVLRVSRCPGPGETITIRSSQMSMGGKGGNQAVACGRASYKSRSTRTANSKITMIGALGGNDHNANLLIKTALESSGVCADMVLHDETESTGAAHIIVEDAGENRILLVPGANHSRKMHDLEGIISMIEAQDPQVLVLQGKSPGLQCLGFSVTSILDHMGPRSCSILLQSTQMA